MQKSTPRVAFFCLVIARQGFPRQGAVARLTPSMGRRSLFALPTRECKTMNFRYLLTLLALLIPLRGQAAPPEGYEFVNLTEAMKRSQSSGKPVFLYFGRYGCSTCRKMHAEVFTDPELAKRLNGDFVLAYVDTESGERIRLPNGERTTEMQFATRSRIIGTPTFVYYSDAREPLFSKAGFQSIEQMRGYSDYVAGGHYGKQTLKEYLASR